MYYKDNKGRPIYTTFVYRHFKGHLVIPVDFATCAETGDKVVVYICFSDMNKYTRKVEDWFTDVTDRPDNTTGQDLRFEVFDISVVN